MTTFGFIAAHPMSLVGQKEEAILAAAFKLAIKKAGQIL
jgi:hypothetical protein